MKSIFGLPENVAAALSYIFGPFSGIAVLIMERENKFVRFHALQSTLWFVLVMVLGWVLGFISRILSVIPLLGRLAGLGIGLILSIGGFLAIVSLVFLMVMAASGKTFKIPIIGDVAWSQVNK